MKVYSLRVLPFVNEDLDQIWVEIAQNDIDVADRFIDRLTEKITGLSTFPQRGAPRPELGKGMPFLVEGHYLIVYRIVKDVVEIVKVVHGARDFDALTFD